MRVLGIETSCDETGVAVYGTKEGLLAQARLRWLTDTIAQRQASRRRWRWLWLWPSTGYLRHQLAPTIHAVVTCLSERDEDVLSTARDMAHGLA